VKRTSYEAPRYILYSSNCQRGGGGGGGGVAAAIYSADEHVILINIQHEVSGRNRKGYFYYTRSQSYKSYDADIRLGVVSL
jgi:hypothetical protein